jgi:hypothetical protein
VFGLITARPTTQAERRLYQARRGPKREDEHES